MAFYHGNSNWILTPILLFPLFQTTVNYGKWYCYQQQCDQLTNNKQLANNKAIDENTMNESWLQEATSHWSIDRYGILNKSSMNSLEDWRKRKAANMEKGAAVSLWNLSAVFQIPMGYFIQENGFWTVDWRNIHYWDEDSFVWIRIT